MSGGGGSGERLHRSEKQEDVRNTNLEAAKALASSIRTSLGPKGMDKMVVQGDGSVTVTNDGATILDRMQVTSPAARMLVELSKSQDVQAGDGTTSVVVLCGALLTQCSQLLSKGVHPTVISDAMHSAASQANEIVEQSLAVHVDLNDHTSLVKAATTALSSKVVAQYSHVFAPIAVDSVLRIVNRNKPEIVDLNDIKIVKKGGSTCEDTELSDGLVFDGRASKGSNNGPTSIQNAKIAIAQFCISPPKTDMESNVVVKDYQAMDRVLKEERNYVLQVIKKVKASGCNVLLVQKSILRDALTDLARHYLAKAKILFVSDIERNDIEFIAKTLNCSPVANIDHLTSDKLGEAELVKEESCGDGHITRVTGIKNKGNTATVLVRGSNQQVLEEAERSLHDSLCAMRCLVLKQYLIPGGSAPEIEIAQQLTAQAKGMTGMESYVVRAFAEAMEVVPYTLAENAGLKPIETVTELRNAHAEGKVSHGINVRKGAIADIREENVMQPMLVTTSANSLATETVRMIMKIGTFFELDFCLLMYVCRSHGLKSLTNVLHMQTTSSRRDNHSEQALRLWARLRRPVDVMHVNMNCRY